MGADRVAFAGMTPWRPDEDIIECAGTEVGLVDLHNRCDFLGVRIEVTQSGIRLVIRFRPTSVKGSSADHYHLIFHGVSSLVVSQLHLADGRDWGLFHALAFDPARLDGRQFEVDTSTLNINFDAASVEFLVSSSHA